MGVSSNGASEGAETLAMRQRRGEVTVGAEAAEATIAGCSSGGADDHGGVRRAASTGSAAGAGAQSESGAAGAVPRVRAQQRKGTAGVTAITPINLPTSS